MASGMLRAFLSGKKYLGLEKEFREERGESLQKFLSRWFARGVVSALVSCAAFLFFEMPFLFFALAAVLPVALPLGALSLQLFLFERERGKKEEAVPALLLQASIFPPKTPVSKMMECFALGEKNAFGKEFKKAVREVKRGASAAEALEGMKARNRGRFFREAVEMLLLAEETGIEMNSVLREKAEEIIEVQAILRERLSLLSIQKATLLLGGGVIVPFILGLLSGMVRSFDLGEFSQMLSGSVACRQEMLNAAVFANQVFVVEYALVSSLFLSFLEGKPRKIFPYALVLVPLGFVVFSLAARAPVI